MKKNKKNNVFDVTLDKEEQEIVDAIERGEFKSVSNLAEEMDFAQKASENFFRKDARVTLRISNSDLNRLKQKAAYKGLPYQTFIASVLHEYAAGHFKDVA